MKRRFRWWVNFWAALASVVLSASITHAFSVSSIQLADTADRVSPLLPTAIETLHVTIAADPADLYLPANLPAAARETALPIALMLPGALVDRTHYSQFASAVARYGFAVVVPTHIRSLPQFGLSGELSEASQIPATLMFLEEENANPNSRLYQKLDPARMALLGHSHGGFVGLQAIANLCNPLFCTPPFSRPDAVKVGVFYGVNSKDPATGSFSSIPNDYLPVALLQGSLDGIATPDEAIATYAEIQTPPKALITVAGSNHYGITDLNNPPGAIPDPSTPTLTQTEGIETIAQWTAYFLRAHLDQDADARQRIYDSDRFNSSAITITSVLE